MFKFSVENLVDNFRNWWTSRGRMEEEAGEKRNALVEKWMTWLCRWKSREFYTKTKVSY